MFTNARKLWQHFFFIVFVVCFTSRFCFFFVLLCFAVVAIDCQHKIFPDSHLCDRPVPQCVQWLFASTTIDLLRFLQQHPSRRRGTSTLRYEVTQSCVYIHGHETIDSINDHQSTTWTSTNKQTEAYTYAYIMHEFLCVYVCLQACVCI